MRLARLALLQIALASGCGPEVVHRPLELFVGGISGRAETLVVLLFPGPEAPACANVQLSNVQGLEAPHRAEWRRDDSEGRGLSLPEVDDGAVTLVVYTEDAGGAAIQFACAELAYADLEAPDVSIQLSARMP